MKARHDTDLHLPIESNFIWKNDADILIWMLIGSWKEAITLGMIMTKHTQTRDTYLNIQSTEAEQSYNIVRMESRWTRPE